MRDIKHTPEGDVDLSMCDFIYAESTEQHKRDLLITTQGAIKEFPTTGVGVVNYINDSEPINLLRAVRKELSRDGMKVYEVSMDNSELLIDAEYEINNG